MVSPDQMSFLEDILLSNCRSSWAGLLGGENFFLRSSHEKKTEHQCQPLKQTPSPGRWKDSQGPWEWLGELALCQGKRHWKMPR